MLLALGFENCQQLSQRTRVKECIGFINGDDLWLARREDHVEHCNDISYASAHAGHAGREVVAPGLGCEWKAVQVEIAVVWWCLHPFHAWENTADPTAKKPVTMCVVGLKMIDAIRQRSGFPIQDGRTLRSALKTGSSLGIKAINSSSEQLAIISNNVVCSAVATRRNLWFKLIRQVLQRRCRYCERYLLATKGPLPHETSG